MSIIKESICSISDPLTHIFNLSITSGIVPTEPKTARVIPLFKTDDKSLISNYRPISVLPSFSKILEKVVYNRLISYLNTYKILSDNQFGFLKHHSTEYALALLHDKISSSIDKRESTAGLFIDLSKSFDTVDHQILLNKLYHYGIHGIAFNWFSSYLSDRQQYVRYNGVNSSRRCIKCGVPQGSILGPLLFLVYINMCNMSKISDLILFADDTNVFFFHTKMLSSFKKP